MDNEKLKALQVAMSQIEKQFGKGSVMKLGEQNILNVEAISTGSLSLDIALGIGGIPRGELLKYLVRNLLVKQQLLFM
jgi:recombination protein RecA